MSANLVVHVQRGAKTEFGMASFGVNTNMCVRLGNLRSLIIPIGFPRSLLIACGRHVVVSTHTHAMPMHDLHNNVHGCEAIRTSAMPRVVSPWEQLVSREISLWGAVGLLSKGWWNIVSSVFCCCCEAF